jgi:hypothetical protein
MNAGVDNDPIAVAHMSDNALAVVGTENADFNLIRSWRPDCCDFRKGHDADRPLPDQRT